MVIRRRTPFNPQLKEYSDVIFRDYRDSLFPSLFGVKPGDITYDDLPKDFREQADYHIAMDAVLSVRLKRESMLFHTMHWTVSYRFRDAEKYQHNQDVTITLCNPISDLLGEISKIAVDYFTYGYFSLPRKRLLEVVIVDMHDLKKAIHRGDIPYRLGGGPNKRTQQPFVTFTFDNLRRINLLKRHFREVNGILVPEWIWGEAA